MIRNMGHFQIGKIRNRRKLSEAYLKLSFAKDVRHSMSKMNQVLNKIITK